MALPRAVQAVNMAVHRDLATNAAKERAVQAGVLLLLPPNAATQPNQPNADVLVMSAVLMLNAVANIATATEQRPIVAERI